MIRRFNISGGILFALLFIYAGATVYMTLSAPTLLSDPGWVARESSGRVEVSAVRPEGPARALREKDRILAINGGRIEDAAQIAEVFQRIEPRTSYTVLIEREGEFYELTLRTDPQPLTLVRIRRAAPVIIQIIFLITGFAVFLLKPSDKQAMLLGLMFGTFSFAASALNPAFAGQTAWLVGVMLTVNIVSSVCWPVILHFFLIFPEPSPLLRKRPRIEGYLYLPYLIIIFPYVALLNMLEAFAPEKVAAFRMNFALVEEILTVTAVLYTAAGLMSLLVNYRQASLSSRRKMRVVVAGCIAGFFPMFLFVGLAFLFNITQTNPALSLFLSLAAVFAFPIFPLSFAYAIVRHQVIPIRIILRRSVRYLLVSRGFIIIQAVVVFAVLSYLLTGSRIAAIDRLGDRADIIATMAATALAIVVLTVVNQRVMPIIDRRFFREAYDAQKILSDLGQAMRTVTTVNQLLSLAVVKIQDALHIENITIFLLDDRSGNYVCAISSHLAEDGASTSDADRNLILPGDGPLVERLQRFGQPLTISPEEITFEAGERGSKGAEEQRNAGAGEQGSYRDSEARTPAPLHPEPQNEYILLSASRPPAPLRKIRSALLLPVSMKDHLLAIVSLGPRLGDVPFSREDKQLLMAVTWQMAFAVQNSQLVQRIAEEERLRHELDIATAVQRRLFPERPPAVERLDLSGVCHPARGVGGDYYDFIVLERGKVGIAVADVAGKGISAALLMSTVQASLRSQAPAVNGRLVDLVSSMNRLLHVSTDAHSFASFFYAQFDQETGLLSYVNAGHNPPLLFQAAQTIEAQGAGQAVAATRDARSVAAETAPDPGRINLLTTGGPVLGAFLGCDYEQEEISMNCGDLLVAYTDGVTESLNEDGEEFGEQRLRNIVHAHWRLSAQDLTEKIVESVREWQSDIPQHDDLTLVVMKVK
ncbi:MAG: SpoIIE family protein phosphatase [Blastocatellia bacterium]|nr:SpoIIE family protein phosphatase [Blastocatellia bacterium]